MGENGVWEASKPSRPGEKVDLSGCERSPACI